MTGSTVNILFDRNNTEESIDNNDTSENQVILIDNFHEDYEDTDNYISVKKESTVCKKRVEGENSNFCIDLHPSAQTEINTTVMKGRLYL